MAHLLEVSVFVDGRRIARLRRERGIPKSIGLRQGLNTTTASGMMRIEDVNVLRKGEVLRFDYERSVSSTIIFSS
jgi:hypothetical protein